MSKTQNIFVVDDDGDFVELLTEILTQSGYQVQSTRQPATALSSIQASEFDLIVMDQRMGELSGVELLKKIRQNKPTIPVIIISGFLENASTTEFINLGVAGIFFKPLNIFALLKRVEEVFKGTIRSSGNAPIPDLGIRGFTRTPFGSSVNKDVFLKKIQSLSSFKGNLLLVGEKGSPFKAIADEIVKKGSPADQVIAWTGSLVKPATLTEVLSGFTLATFLIENVDKLTPEEKSTIYKLSKHEAPFENLSAVRFIFCLSQELDALYEAQLIDDEFYIFLGNLELKVPKLTNPQNLHKVDELQRAAQLVTGATERVMVLDDEDIHAQMVVDLLEGGGYKTLKIINPAEALVALRKERFCLIITDFRMPGINGLDFIAQTRQIDQSVPVLVLTGNIQLPEMVRIANMGITKLVQKPLDMKLFLEEIKNIARV